MTNHHWGLHHWLQKKMITCLVHFHLSFLASYHSKRSVASSLKKCVNITMYRIHLTKTQFVCNYVLYGLMMDQPVSECLDSTVNLLSKHEPFVLVILNLLSTVCCLSYSLSLWYYGISIIVECYTSSTFTCVK